MSIEIYKNTKVNSIKNREQYTKLILYKPVNSKQFPNVKEVEVYFDPIINNKLNLTNIEKINFFCESVGINDKPISGMHYKSINSYGIKSVSFSSSTNSIAGDLLENLKDLEEIEFNVFDNNIIFKTGYHLKGLDVQNSKKLKKIIVNDKNGHHEINLDFFPKRIDYLGSDEDNTSIEISDEDVKYIYTIKKDSIEREVILIRINMKDDTFYIADNINEIALNWCLFQPGRPFEFKKISLSLNHLKNNFDFSKVLSLDALKSIEVRNNNDMALFESKKYLTEDFGKPKSLKIKDNKLLIRFKSCFIEINQNGEEIKTSKESSEDILNKYTKEQLKYMRYLLCFDEIYKDLHDNDTTLNESLETIRKTLTKKIGE